MHRAIAASKYAFRIDMADWLAENLAEAREWLCADVSAPEWNRFTRYVLACEGHARPNNERIAKREAQTRKVVRGLYVSDARLRQPLGLTRAAFYDLIITGFCIDAISSDPAVWRRCMRNVTSMLQPGGTFIIHALHQCKAYKCGDRMFPGSNLSIDDMRDAMLENGFVNSSIDVQVIPCATTRCTATRAFSRPLAARHRRRRARPDQTLWMNQTTPAMPSAHEPSGSTAPAYQRVARIE